MRLSNFLNVSETKINISKYMGIKTSKEIKNIESCHIEDGLAVLKFIIELKQKKINPKNEYEVSEILYNKRKEGINFFRNSFDYISAFDSNAAIVHYKPHPEKSLPSKNKNLLLIDSGAQYLEGTTDITRVIKIGAKNFTRIKFSYTYLLKSLIKIENKIFPRNIRTLEIDLFIRKYLSKFNISYNHGTGHGVGNFGDVHEKYPIISPRSNDILVKNALFSIEPGYYVEGQFGLRIENLYVTKNINNSLKLKNITLVPYDLDLVNFQLITNFERNYIKKFHTEIYKTLKPRLSNYYRDYFIKNLINKI
jgi:Xaa-Pro aminopeptidase